MGTPSVACSAAQKGTATLGSTLWTAASSNAPKAAPQDASKPDGARRYEGYAVPLMVAEDAAAAASQYETPHELPPVATDHHHEHGHGHGEHLFHAHGGAAHMH